MLAEQSLSYSRAVWLLGFTAFTVFTSSFGRLSPVVRTYWRRLFLNSWLD